MSNKSWLLDLARLVTLSIISVDFGDNVVTGIGRWVNACREVETLRTDDSFQEIYYKRIAETGELQEGDTEPRKVLRHLLQHIYILLEMIQKREGS